MNYLIFALTYIFKTKILRKKIPLIAGLVVGESCNLNCKHCNVSSAKEEKDLSFEEIKTGLNILHNKGIRLLAITGGEPFLWQDNNYTIEDITRYAKEIGYKIISIYTNGTKQIESSADNLFVSIDGLKESSNKLRGNIYDTVIRNITESKHPSIIINCTINNKNKNEIEELCEYISSIKNVKGIFFYFHTPYFGIDDLFLPFVERQKIINELIALKKRYKILNSTACLWDVYYNRWERPTELCLVYANNKIFKCCRSVGKPEVCEECGYLGYPEIINISNLKPSAIWSALNYLPVKKTWK